MVSSKCSFKVNSEYKTGVSGIYATCRLNAVGCCVKTTSFKLIFPFCGRNKPKICLMVVDLPAPFKPIRPKASPVLISKLISLITGTPV